VACLKFDFEPPRTVPGLKFDVQLQKSDRPGSTFLDWPLKLKLVKFIAVTESCIQSSRAAMVVTLDHNETFFSIDRERSLESDYQPSSVHLPRCLGGVHCHGAERTGDLYGNGLSQSGVVPPSSIYAN
jgi:hypothetical protein